MTSPRSWGPSQRVPSSPLPASSFHKTWGFPFRATEMGEGGDTGRDGGNSITCPYRPLTSRFLSVCTCCWHGPRVLKTSAWVTAGPPLRPIRIPIPHAPPGRHCPPAAAPRQLPRAVGIAPRLRPFRGGKCGGRPEPRPAGRAARQAAGSFTVATGRGRDKGRCFRAPFGSRIETLSRRYGAGGAVGNFKPIGVLRVRSACRAEGSAGGGGRWRVALARSASPPTRTRTAVPSPIPKPGF